MSVQTEDLNKLKNKLRNLEKEQAEIKGELASVNKQFESMGIDPEDDIDEWIKEKKEEMVAQRKTLSKLTEDIENLFDEYEEEEDD